MANAGATGAYLLASLCEAMDGHPNVAEVRGVGLLCAVEFQEDPGARRWFPTMSVAPKIAAAMLARGVIARPLPEGDIIGFAPPLCFTRAEVDTAVAALRDAVREVLGG